MFGMAAAAFHGGLPRAKCGVANIDWRAHSRGAHAQQLRCASEHGPTPKAKPNRSNLMGMDDFRFREWVRPTLLKIHPILRRE